MRRRFGEWSELKTSLAERGVMLAVARLAGAAARGRFTISARRASPRPGPGPDERPGRRLLRIPPTATLESEPARRRRRTGRTRMTRGRAPRVQRHGAIISVLARDRSRDVRVYAVCVGARHRRSRATAAAREDGARAYANQRGDREPRAERPSRGSRRRRREGTGRHPGRGGRGGRRGGDGTRQGSGHHLTPPRPPRAGVEARARRRTRGRGDDAEEVQNRRGAPPHAVPGAKPPRTSRREGRRSRDRRRRTRGRPTRRTRTPTPTPTLSRTTWRWTRCPRLRPRGRAA